MNDFRRAKLHNFRKGSKPGLSQKCRVKDHGNCFKLACLCECHKASLCAVE